MNEAFKRGFLKTAITDELRLLFGMDTPGEGPKRIFVDDLLNTTLDLPLGSGQCWQ